ncbi:hypothetical protein JTB14_013731 [Gonioctena quinquepunctata]|nr:hypothetical protein JTB14_013731 [Gonioctena quinquepunctata]
MEFIQSSCRRRYVLLQKEICPHFLSPEDMYPNQSGHSRLFSIQSQSEASIRRPKHSKHYEVSLQNSRDTARHAPQREVLRLHPFSDSQHAYQCDRGTERVLHRLVHGIGGVLDPNTRGIFINSGEHLITHQKQMHRGYTH